MSNDEQVMSARKIANSLLIAAMAGHPDDNLGPLGDKLTESIEQYAAALLAPHLTKINRLEGELQDAREDCLGLEEQLAKAEGRNKVDEPEPCVICGKVR